MTVDEGNVATAALAIAISALVIAACQFISQLFSTADGYRRCQPSIIGDWFHLVELPFRWSSFRFEVKVTTPHFTIASIRDSNINGSYLRHPEKGLPSFPQSLFVRKKQYLINTDDPVPLLGTEISRYGTFSEIRAPKKNDDYGVKSWELLEDAPTWMNLLRDIHGYQGTNFGNALNKDHRNLQNTSTKNRYSHHFQVISIGLRTRTWDFMPPDIVRPVASTTLGDLITMTHRMGMKWLDFRPREGKISSIGRENGFSTTLVRGMGLVVEYNTLGGKFDFFAPCIPDDRADQMACGILPDGKLDWLYSVNLRHEDLAAADQLNRILLQLGMPDEVEKTLLACLSNQHPASRFPGLADILGLHTDWLRYPFLTHLVDNPFPFPITTMRERAESAIVWSSILTKRKTSLSEPCLRLLKFYEVWEGLLQVLPIWNAERTAVLADTFDATTAYFKDHRFNYRLLVEAHVIVNCASFEAAEKNIRTEHHKTRDVIPVPGTNEPYQGDPIFTERAYIYTENIPAFVAAAKMAMEERDYSIQGLCFEDAWWMMMMRLHTWTLAHKWVDREGVKIPSKYYNDPTRVYIL